MNEREIAEYISGLKLRKAAWGYEKSDVISSYQKLDSMYRDLMETESKKYLAQLESKEKEILELKARVEECVRTQAQFATKNDELTRKNAELNSLVSDVSTEKEKYHSKADALTTAIALVDAQKKTIEQQIEQERKKVTEAALQEIQLVADKQKEELAQKRTQELSDIYKLNQTKLSASKQLKRIIAEITAMLNTIPDDDMSSN